MTRPDISGFFFGINPVSIMNCFFFFYAFTYYILLKGPGKMCIHKK